MKRHNEIDIAQTVFVIGIDSALVRTRISGPDDMFVCFVVA